MNKQLHRLAIPLILLLAACRPAVSEYSDAEAPKQLTVDSAATSASFKFLPGSDRLAPGEAERLQRMAAAGAIVPGDRVTVAAAGEPRLAAGRQIAISRELLGYGVVAYARPLPALPPDQAVVEIGRYLVTLPPCPNWSKPPANDFTNAVSSNLGCATAVNLGQMVAYPADLVGGQPQAQTVGVPAASAVNRYLHDKITPLPSAAAGLPLAGGGASAAPSGGETSGPGATGSQ
jgi:pilus assembly protein CpaD